MCSTLLQVSQTKVREDIFQLRMFEHQISPSMEKPILFNSGSLLQPPYLTNHQSLICLPWLSALSVSPSFLKSFNQIEPRNRNRNSRRTHIALSSCHGREPINASSNQEKKKDEKQGKQSLLLRFLADFENLGKKLKENMSPKQKGDWKDVMLMSLSFAVYVYISQKLVCAYCAWTSMPNQNW